MPKIGAIDMGSNAIRFYIVEKTGDSAYRVLENLREPIRLGGDVFLSGNIREENIRRAEQAFRRFRQILKQHNVQTVRAVATCATREAGNADVVLDRLEKASGIRVEVVTGEEEARLISLAVGTRIPLEGKSALIVDLGGGSVEITLVENGRITMTDSHNFGAVRLLDVLSSAGEDLVQTGTLLKEYMELISRKLDRRGGGRKAPLFIATGGNIETIAQVPEIRAEPHPEYPGTVRVKPTNLRKFMEEISGMTVKARMERYGLREDRADVILPACYVYHKIAELHGSNEILVPGVSLKDGLVLDTMARDREAEHGRNIRDQVLVSCRQLAKRFQVDLGHAAKVAELAGQLFDQTASLHGLAARHRLCLEAASLLHDIGYFISIQKHHKHSFYIIANSEIVGFSPEDRLLVACVARYHRKSPPAADHEEFTALPKKDRAAIRSLASILRIADALDKEHSGAIRGIACQVENGRLTIQARSRTSGRLEGLSLEKNAVMFRECFGVDVRLLIQPEN
ncbi:MAG TPA: Ppx/GppA phosphatase family protein [Candidatus Deferrimicrobiaceae bacterium]|jgi:exopolyphosphatase/guanosine-5'-triphosphate,3'-diphosphate pyrophosphatase